MEDSKTVQQHNRGFWANPITILLSVVVLFLVSQLIATTVVSLIAWRIANQNYQTVLYISVNLAVVLLLITTAMTVLKFSWKNIGIKHASVKSYLAVIPVAFAYVAFSTFFTYLATRLVSGFDIDQVQNVGLSDMASKPELVAAFFSLVVLTPIVEEIVFRGLLFKSLRRIIKISFLPLTVITLGFATLGTILVLRFDADSVPAEATPLLFMTFVLIILTTGMVLNIWLKQAQRYQKLNALLHKKDSTFWSAAILTSLLFAAAHMQWNVAVDTFALSLALCYLVEKSNSIVPAIFLHALKNSLAFVLLFIIK